MSDLKWFRHGERWRAGRYFIDKLAPRFFVLTQKLRRRGFEDEEKIEASSSSLPLLKYEAEMIEKAKTKRRRVIRSGLVFFLCVVAFSLGLLSSGAWASVVILLSATGGWFALLRLVDAAMGRPYEALGDVYQ